MIAALALLYALPGAAQDAAPPAIDETSWSIPPNAVISALLEERMAHNGVGIVVGVIEQGRTRIVAHGRSGASDERPLDGDSVFQIGSVTKVFTGLLLADMVQRGEVDVEDPAAKYLPPNVKMPERGRPITLLDLSKHLSGLPSMPTNFSLSASPNPYEGYTVEQLYTFLSTYEPPRAPGKQVYSNLGVALLGRLLARHASTDYETLLRQRVLDPLELHSTSITLSADQKRRLVPGHDRYREPVETWELRAMPASGSLRSTANDLLAFLAFNLDERRSTLHAAMLYQRTPMRALGWGRSQLGGEDVYGHEGGKEGYRSAVLFNPKRRTGVVVLMNARTDERPIELALHLLYPDHALRPAAHAPERPESPTLEAKALERFAGTYRLESGEALDVARRRDHLIVNMSGEGVSTFFPLSEREFFSNTDDARIVFSVGADGRATELSLYERGAQKRASRLD